VDMGNATEQDLAELLAACQKATFGVDQKVVLDETYRKAGKMDLNKFAARLDVVASGLLAAMTPYILQGQDLEVDKALMAEMYKLNVYGTSVLARFFKAHKDSPRAVDNMIGSLVIIFPAPHSDGALTLEQGGTTGSFDTTHELTAQAAPSAVAYVAFYSDVTLLAQID
ncbi:hypothetical protein FB451DRAFT_1025219, partial [Mycena latifolia]